MAEGSIPFSAIDRYASRTGIVDPDEFASFSGVIRSLDRTYLSLRSKNGSDQAAPALLKDAASVKAALKELSQGWEARERDLIALKRQMQADAAKDEE